jgi:hypothetical protein
MIVNLSALVEALKNHSEVVKVGSARARPLPPAPGSVQPSAFPLVASVITNTNNCEDR